MNLGNVLFSPSGRLGPASFQKAALILIVIGFVLSLATLISVSLGIIAGVISLALIYPWIVIWVKRLHDAGKSGWMVLLVILVYLIVSMIASQIITGMFGSAAPAAAPTDFSGMMAMIQAQAQATALPNAIVSALISVIFVFAGNAILKSDPGTNRFGPPPADG